MSAADDVGLHHWWMAVAFDLLYIGHVLSCIQGSCSPYITVIMLHVVTRDAPIRHWPIIGRLIIGA